MDYLLNLKYQELLPCILLVLNLIINGLPSKLYVHLYLEMIKLKKF